ncbi:MAG TPA: isochorismatase family cysteine hydrolase [Terriglobales bacterium]|nr:isochorismatase family cysteine hydrolase [Terriglobales bacterium]
MRELVFWDVDTQVDFMHPEGKLYVRGAENIIGNIQRLTSFAVAHGILIVASVDAHEETDPEFREYPPHCLAGTAGQKKIERTLLPGHYVVPNRKISLPQNLAYPQIIVEKQATDVFTNPNVEELLVHMGRDREIVLYGVVTEICVDQAARGLSHRGYRVHLVRDAIQHLDAAKGRATRAEVERRGGRLFTTDEVLAGAPAKVA